MEELKGDANKALTLGRARFDDLKSKVTAWLVAAGPRKLLKILVGFVVLSFSFLLLITFPKNLEAAASEWNPYRVNPNHLPESLPADKERRFAFIIPASGPGPELCKTIVSAMALGYPSPVIINWGLNHTEITKWQGGRNLPKIPGFVKYLDAVMAPDAHPSERLGEEDIVLLVDAYDVWFQLPPQVLLSRYHEINRKADARLQKQWKRNEPMPMRQTVVAASGKRCTPNGPKSGVDLRCDVWPESPLRKDLYGPMTEKKSKNFRNHRPRYINGGVYIGQAGDMRRLFRRAMEKMELKIGHGFKWKSEQAIPGEVLGEQESWRRWRRENNVSDLDLGGLLNRDFEYHFGVDYAQDISIQTYWTKGRGGLFDGAFVSLNNKTDIDKHSKERGIRPTRLKGVPKDIRDVQNPLTPFVKSPDWGEMPLYADFWTKSVPVIIHHNGWKARRFTLWDKPWFHTHLRKMLSLRLKEGEPKEPLATVETKNNRIRYWPVSAEDSNKNPRQMNGTANERLPKMEWKDVCRYPTTPMSVKLGGAVRKHHYWEELFRDHDGPIRKNS